MVFPMLNPSVLDKRLLCPVEHHPHACPFFVGIVDDGVLPVAENPLYADFHECQLAFFFHFLREAVGI